MQHAKISTEGGSSSRDQGLLQPTGAYYTCAKKHFTTTDWGLLQLLSWGSFSCLGWFSFFWGLLQPAGAYCNWVLLQLLSWGLSTCVGSPLFGSGAPLSVQGRPPWFRGTLFGPGALSFSVQECPFWPKRTLFRTSPSLCQAAGHAPNASVVKIAAKSLPQGTSPKGPAPRF